ncbi:MAG: protease HtpX [Chlamydiales bacterium]|jgi:heat shock protein HtpX|nr:protease HtpX [Chlamydiales bacterium]
MAIAKRVFLFLLVNFLVIMTLSFFVNIFNIKPYLQSYGLNLYSLMIFCFIWGMGGALISLLLSRKIALWMMKIQLIDSHTKDSSLQRLLTIVHKFSRDANLSDFPQVGIYNSPELNAFATGPTKKRSLIAVSTGLLNRMSEKELEGVIAHEMTHIQNGDMVTMTLLQGVINAFVMFLARVLAYICSGLGKSRNNSSGGSYISYAIFVFLFEVIFMVLGSLIICAFSRFREFRADRGGAFLAGRENMIAALKALQKNVQIQDPQATIAAFQAFKISIPEKRSITRWFATHPPLEARIEKLESESHLR